MSWQLHFDDFLFGQCVAKFVHLFFGEATYGTLKSLWQHFSKLCMAVVGKSWHTDFLLGPQQVDMVYMCTIMQLDVLYIHFSQIQQLVEVSASILE